MFTPTEYTRFREFHGHFYRTAAFFERAGGLTVDGATRGVLVTAVLDDFFGTAGIYAMLGRCIKGAETGGKTSDIAMLSHNLWQSVFHSDRDIIGKTDRIGSHREDRGRRDAGGVSVPESHRCLGAFRPLALDAI